MAEENKSPDVEIDTDGVQEQTIDVDAPNVGNEEFEKKQDVDLGYVDVSNQDKQEEPKRRVFQLASMLNVQRWSSKRSGVARITGAFIGLV